MVNAMPIMWMRKRRARWQASVSGFDGCAASCRATGGMMGTPIDYRRNTVMVKNLALFGRYDGYSSQL